jgi:hypothetical protein
VIIKKPVIGPRSEEARCYNVLADRRESALVGTGKER